MKTLLVLSAVALLAGCTADRPVYHPPSDADLASWNGAPAIELETHAYFSTRQRETRPLSDGSEMWVFADCHTKRKAECERSAFSWTAECTSHDTTKCCNHQFVMRGGVVASYRPLGTCSVGCGIRPASKVQACEAASARD